ncbi:MAG: aminotransferase class V-fold PLP-dependent enzyme [Ruminococcaceae bacterium]|nr:aminotransferase class V-fold PLP-dependent enzyme [Oscillospiraceae bacterium]
MKTPIVDFVKRYAEMETLRLHMPGHKGENLTGFEKYDITEINGADSLYDAVGIIRESEENASRLFGCNTFYSTEGSSLCIRAMLYLAIAGKENPTILAGRNAHKTFITASALLGFDIEWLYSDDNYLSCYITPKDVENAINNAENKPSAVYVTSPDYLGNMLDIKGISKVCKKYGVLLLVDNAHGAYLKFLTPSLHPIDMGADMCCDSAHKTLPALTGGAYLHISESADGYFKVCAKEALSLFGSTSPSYLILQSLDFVNKYLSEGYEKKLSEYVKKLSELKKILLENGYSLLGNEPLKITLDTKKYGYKGTELAKLLESQKLYPEFADNDFLVLMFTPEISDLERVKNVLCSLQKKAEIKEGIPVFEKPSEVISVRNAMLSRKVLLPIEKAENRILASPSVGCPPAVPIAVCGERITRNVINAFEYYGIEKCFVIE